MSHAEDGAAVDHADVRQGPVAAKKAGVGDIDGAQVGQVIQMREAGALPIMNRVHNIHRAGHGQTLGIDGQ